MPTDAPLSVTLHVKWWVRPVVAILAVLGFAICLVAPRTGERYTNAVIRWVGRVGIVVGET